MYTKTIKQASVAQWLFNEPCKPGIAGLIPGFLSLSDETINSSRFHMTLAVGWASNLKSTNQLHSSLT